MSVKNIVLPIFGYIALAVNSMKKVIIILCAALALPYFMLRAQTAEELKLLNACKEEVSAINSLTLYKKQFLTNIRRANLRKSPSTDAERIAFIEMGDIVKIEERAGDQWYKISANGQAGYIFSEFIEPVEREVK